VGLVDVPGHEDFVKNMVAGVGTVDLALFVVAADDGWMPQTEEHLQILTYLGVGHAVVALTKVDLLPESEAAAIASLSARLQDTPFAAAPIVPTSVVTGYGVAELKAALAGALAAVPPPPDLGKPRLPIDRAFTLHGIGTVVTGTLSGGALRRNQTLVVQPSGRTTRIRSLQTHNRDVEQALPGTRTALNLPDLPVASTEGVARGQVITLAELGGPTSTLDARLEKSARLSNSKNGAARPLKDGTLVHLHHGSTNVPARLFLLSGEPLHPGQESLAQLRLDQPLLVLGGDRFILRDWPEQHTLAGGVILDAEASRKQFRSEPQQRLLQQRASAAGDPGVWAQSQLERDHALRRSTLLRKTRFCTRTIDAAVAQLVAEDKAWMAGDWIVDGAWWRQIRQSAGNAIQAHHQAHPERVGLPLNDLRRLLPLPDSAVFDVLVAEMCRTDFRQIGTEIRHAAHRPALPPGLEAAGSSLRAALAAKPFEPPARKELTANPLSQQAMRFLLETGEAIEVGPELVMLTEHFARAREKIRQLLRERGPTTASDLRQALGTNRRVIIPLLERLDRDGITHRQGDHRILRS
jgi:selenocysteine-specific elongation factor